MSWVTSEVGVVVLFAAVVVALVRGYSAFQQKQDPTRKQPPALYPNRRSLRHIHGPTHWALQPTRLATARSIAPRPPIRRRRVGQPISRRHNLPRPRMLLPQRQNRNLRHMANPSLHLPLLELLHGLRRLLCPLGA